MAFSIVTFADTVKNLVDKNNTTTSSYDVSASLKARVVKSTVGYHKSKPIPNTNFPCVWVEPRHVGNEYVTIGRSALRDITVDMDIFAITNAGLGLANGRETADREMLQLSTNIETMLRNYPQLSATSYVMSAVITDVTYDVTEANDTYNSIAHIELQTKIKSV
jgi:hypothetical protein